MKEKKKSRKWWIILIVFLVIAGIGGSVGTLGDQNGSKNSHNGNSIVGDWVCQDANNGSLDDLILYEDGTGIADSYSFNWRTKDQTLILDFGEVQHEFQFQLDNGTLYIDGFAYVLRDTIQETQISNLLNTVWEPDFVEYLGNTHPDNPEMTLSYVSSDGTLLQFEDSYGKLHTARICNGWDHPGTYDPEILASGIGVQYLFDDPEFFYGMTLYLDGPYSDWEEPTIMVHTTRASTFNNPIYKIKD